MTTRLTAREQLQIARTQLDELVLTVRAIDELMSLEANTAWQGISRALARELAQVKSDRAELEKTIGRLREELDATRLERDTAVAAFALESEKNETKGDGP